RSMTRPLAQVTAGVEAFARGAPVTMPTGAGGEIGMLARAFQRMATEVGQKTTALTAEIDLHRRTAARQRIFDAAVEPSPDAIGLRDLDGTTISGTAAAERLYGWTAAETVGQPVLSVIIPPDRLEEARNLIRRVNQGETIPSFDTERITKDGRRIAVSH